VHDLRTGVAAVEAGLEEDGLAGTQAVVRREARVMVVAAVVAEDGTEKGRYRRSYK